MSDAVIAVANIKNNYKILLYYASYAYFDNSEWEVLGRIVNAWPRTAAVNAPSVLVYRGDKVAVVLITSPYVFANKVLSVAAEKGYHNHLFVLDLIDKFVGNNAPVVFASEFNEPYDALTTIMRINPTQLLTGLLIAIIR
jgi:hypothetical protein